MIIDPNVTGREDLSALITGIVAPRPIAWVSTVSRVGVPNLAPFSFFNAFSFAPPTIAVGPGFRDGFPKDTLENLIRTDELVVNVVTERLAAAANETSADFPADFNEWSIVGVTPEASRLVRPPRVAQSPAAFECVVRQVIPLGSADAPANCLVLADVVLLHIDDAVLDGSTPDPDALALVGRMGGALWTTTRDRFELARPRASGGAHARREPTREDAS